MLLSRSSDLKSSEIPSRALFLKRREFMRTAAGLGVAGSIYGAGLLLAGRAHAGSRLAGVKKGAYILSDALTPLVDVTSYNNSYEFGTDKKDPAADSRTA